MKKTISTLVTVLAFGVLAEDTVVDGGSVLSKNVIKDHTSTFLPIAIRFDVSADTPYTVAGIVQTSTLAAGDKLHVYDHVHSRYDVYQLKADKTWEPVQIVASGSDAPAYTSPDADKRYLEKGYGFWLQRGETSVTNDVYLCGRLADTATFTVAAGGAKATHTLLGVAKDSPLSLDGAHPFTGAVAGDEIHVPQNDGTMVVYRFSKNGNWISTMKNGTLAPIPSGSVYWYVRKAGQPAFDVTMSL